MGLPESHCIGTDGKKRITALTKTELLTSVPPRGCVEGENGFFLATPAVVEYFDYWLGQTFRYEKMPCVGGESGY